MTCGTGMRWPLYKKNATDSRHPKISRSSRMMYFFHPPAVEALDPLPCQGWFARQNVRFYSIYDYCSDDESFDFIKDWIEFATTRGGSRAGEGTSVLPGADRKLGGSLEGGGCCCPGPRAAEAKSIAAPWQQAMQCS